MIRISERGGNEAPSKDEQLLIQVSPSTKQKGNVFFRYRNRWESLWQYLVNVLSKSSTLKAKWRGEDLELTLKNTTVTAGSYTETNITVGADGRITQASNGAKTSTIVGNETSAVYYPNVKGIVDWIKQGLTAYLTTLGLTKATPVDADSLLLNDSADSNKLKLLSWANLKATLKTYFDTLYQGKPLVVATASNSPAIDFEVDFSVYKKYIIEFTNVQSSVNYTDDLWLRVGTGSPVAYQSGANDYSWIRNNLSTATTAATANTASGAYSDTKIILDPFMNNTGVYSVSGSVVIYNPSDSTYHKNIEWTSAMRWITATLIIGTSKYSGAATYRSASAITGLRIMSSTGNILTGTFKLYGVA